jgi:hypothetical protein
VLPSAAGGIPVAVVSTLAGVAALDEDDGAATDEEEEEGGFDLKPGPSFSQLARATAVVAIANIDMVAKRAGRMAPSLSELRGDFQCSSRALNKRRSS